MSESKQQLQLRIAVIGMLLFSVLAPSMTAAHLMVAQHGTLNFVDDSAYMVLSLPASAFSDADENNDGLLSITEFSQHRKSIIAVVSEKTSLSNEDVSFTLHDLRVSPVTPHHAPKDPAEQIIAMGRFSVTGEANELVFFADIFGAQPETQSLEITATRKSTDDKHVFELSPTVNKMTLKFNQPDSLRK